MLIVQLLGATTSYNHFPPKILAGCGLDWRWYSRNNWWVQQLAL